MNESCHTRVTLPVREGGVISPICGGIMSRNVHVCLRSHVTYMWRMIGYTHVWRRHESCLLCVKEESCPPYVKEGSCLLYVKEDSCPPYMEESGVMSSLCE